MIIKMKMEEPLWKDLKYLLRKKILHTYFFTYFYDSKLCILKYNTPDSAFTLELSLNKIILDAPSGVMLCLLSCCGYEWASTIHNHL